MKSSFLISAILSSVIAVVTPAKADNLFNFSTGNPTNAMASASRPDVGGSFEIESADDFVTTGIQTSINSASFTGLLVPGSGATPAVSQVTVEIYRVFPADSNTVRAPNVPTRTNSPSDVALDSARLSRWNPQLYHADFGSHFYSFEFCSTGWHSSEPLTNNWGQRFTDWARGTIQCDLPNAFQSFGGSLFLRTPSSANQRRSVLLALCGSPYRSAGYAVPSGRHRFAKLDARRDARSRLAAHRNGHCRRGHTAGLQRCVFARWSCCYTTPRRTPTLRLGPRCTWAARLAQEEGSSTRCVIENQIGFSERPPRGGLSVLDDTRQCPLMAQNGHTDAACQCPLSEVKGDIASEPGNVRQ